MVPGSSAASGSVEEGGRVHEGSVAWHAWHRTGGVRIRFGAANLGILPAKGIYVIGMIKWD